MRVGVLLATIVVFATGCASFPSVDSLKLRNPLSKKDKAPEPYPNPARIAVTWSADTLSTPGKTTTRGFGGRLFFYNDRSQAVPVEGELMVVGYMESSNPGEPPFCRRFGFTKEQFTKHFSQSDLGASYSIWIPWDADGSPVQKVTLVASFTTAEGRVIQCAPTIVALPGPSLASYQAAQQRRAEKRFSELSGPYPHGQPYDAGVRQTGFSPGPYPGSPSSGFLPAPAAAPSGVTTTTIPIRPGVTPRNN